MLFEEAKDGNLQFSGRNLAGICLRGGGEGGIFCSPAWVFAFCGKENEHIQFSADISAQVKYIQTI